MPQTSTRAGEPSPGGGRPARLLGIRHSDESVAARNRLVYEAVLRGSEHVREGNFTVIAVKDLQRLFDLYDNFFFDALLNAMIREDGAELTFRLSNRMTRSGGTTARRRERRRSHAGPAGRVAYEITVSTLLLFESFRDPARTVTVGGLACHDRLEALQRVFEHELLHLAEFLGWGASSCSGETFHHLSRNLFGHAGVTHDLVTPRETAATAHGIRQGDRVVFEHEGVRRAGVVNRITRRATVLVDDPRGELYSNGKRYLRFYVPLPMLRREDGSGGPT